jgi:hypothetical protein
LLDKVFSVISLFETNSTFGQDTGSIVDCELILSGTISVLTLEYTSFDEVSISLSVIPSEIYQIDL